MVHGDDNGLILPPKIAPVQVVIIPIPYKGVDKDVILEKSNKISKILMENDISVVLDDRTGYTPGWKFNEWEMKGVPLRIELGPKDLAANHVVVARRDKGRKEKLTVGFDGLKDTIVTLLDDIQRSMFQDALKFREENSHNVDTYDEFKTILEEQGGFLYAHWCGSSECEHAAAARDTTIHRTGRLSRPIPTSRWKHDQPTDNWRRETPCCC